MDHTDTIPTPTAFDDEDIRPPRRDPRRVIACFIVCALAATAVFLVARTDTGTEASDAAASSTPLTPEGEGEPEVRPSAGSREPDVDGSDDDDGSFIEQLFADRLDRAGANARRGNDTSSRAPAEGAQNAGSMTVQGRNFTLDLPEEWSGEEVGGTYKIDSPDFSAAIAVSVHDTPPDGYRFEQWANEWEAAVREQFVHDLQIVDRGKFSSAGMDAFRVRYTGTLEGQQVSGEMWWLGDGELVWTLDRALYAGNPHLERVCEDIFRSFRPAVRS